MKKHLVFTFLFAITATLTALANARTDAYAETLSKSALPSEQPAGIAACNYHDDDRTYCDCNKCQKNKKSKKDKGCNQKGNHYGKHKNKHAGHSCSCDHNSCGNRKQYGDDDDCRYGHHRDNDDHQYRRDRDNDDRRYGRDDEYRRDDRPAQRNPVVKVKSRPTPTSKPVPTRTGAKTKSAQRPRPVGN